MPDSCVCVIMKRHLKAVLLYLVIVGCQMSQNHTIYSFFNKTSALCLQDAALYVMSLSANKNYICILNYTSDIS